MKPLVHFRFSHLAALLGTLLALATPDPRTALAQTADSLNPGVGSGSQQVFSLALQTDGKVLVAGSFSTVGGQSRGNVARLNADGTLDSGFKPGADGSVTSVGVQADGKILIGGSFTTLGGQPRNCLARLNADGTLDSGFNPEANGGVFSLAVQADGKILVGGTFTTLGSQARTYLARLNADGTLDAAFNPRVGGSYGYVYSLVVQADGKIVVGGNFTALGGQARNHLGRLSADGTLDSSFNSGTSGTVGTVYSLAAQGDGKILVGGMFSTLGGQPRYSLGRLNNTTPATQTLSSDGSTINWLRGGSSPEVWRTTFEASTNGSDWSLLGQGLRISGGWQLSDVLLPAASTIRARGYAAGGYCNASSWVVESRLLPGGSLPPQIILNDGRFGFGTNGFGFNLSGTAGQTVVVEGSRDLVDWLPLQTNTLGSGEYYFSGPAAAGISRQFYRARLSP